MCAQRAGACLCSCNERLMQGNGGRCRAPPSTLLLAKLTRWPGILSRVSLREGVSYSGTANRRRVHGAVDVGENGQQEASLEFLGGKSKLHDSEVGYSGVGKSREEAWKAEVKKHLGRGMAMSEGDCDDVKKRVVVIAGPTAVGKTRLALAVAKRLGGEIISADSVQVYRGLDVGSAKTPVKDREGIAHHLIDIVDPTEDYTAGRFYDDARAATELVLAKGAVPIIVGGTGMYLRWYMNGKVGAPKATEEIAAAVEEDVGRLISEGGGWDAAVDMLVEAGDPTTAHSLARNDWYRLQRALQIIKASGLPRGAFPQTRIADESPSNGKTKGDYDFQCYFLYQPRPVLYQKIDLRCEEMVAEGLLKEASWLLDSGVQPNSNSASRAIGYQQAVDFLLECRAAEGVATEERFLMFLSAFQQASRNYVKRQLTWFRNEGQSERMFNWMDATQPLDNMVEALANAYLWPAVVGTHSNGGAATKEASYKEGKLLKIYRTTNRVFANCEQRARVLEWIHQSQGKKKLVSPV